MQKKYRKKPVEIEAIQFWDNAETLEALSRFGLDPLIVDYSNRNLPALKIETLGGAMMAKEGDYIIKGVRGEFYSCKPDIFLQTYERVE